MCILPEEVLKATLTKESSLASFKIMTIENKT